LIPPPNPPPSSLALSLSKAVVLADLPDVAKADLLNVMEGGANSMEWLAKILFKKHLE